MVVAVPRKDTEDHAAKKLFVRARVVHQLPRHVEGLLVRIENRIVEIHVRKPAQCLHMKFAAVGQPVKAPRHEMPPVPELTVRHLHTRRARHERIGVFDASVAPFVIAVLIAVSVQTVELDEPVAEVRRQGNLSRADLARLLVPADERLRARTSRRRSDAENRRIMAHAGLQLGTRLATLLEDVVRQLRKLLHVHRLGTILLVQQGRHVFERTHTPLTRIREPVKRVQILRPLPLLAQPGRDDLVAELVRQRIRQKSRQTLKGPNRQIGKLIARRSERHHKRRDLDAHRTDLIRVLKLDNGMPLAAISRSNAGSPEKDIKCLQHFISLLLITPFGTSNIDHGLHFPTPNTRRQHDLRLPFLLHKFMKRNRRLGESQVQRRQHLQLTHDLQHAVKTDPSDTIFKTRQATPRNTAALSQLSLLDMCQNAAIRNPSANLLPK